VARTAESQGHSIQALDSHERQDLATTGRARYWLALLVVSYLFYACWVPIHLLVLGAATLVGYAVGLGLTVIASRTGRLLVAGLGVTAVLGLLVAFKVQAVLTVATRSAVAPFAVTGRPGAASVVVPLGLSFLSLRLVSYIVDVFHRRIPPERNLGVLALYVAFFPEVMAGPIDRAGDLIPQLRSRFSLDYARITNGLKLVAWGLFKKLVVAERLSLFVDPVFHDPSRFPGLSLLTATVFYAFQIYCDFSAYSDIAIGLGEVLGFTLSRNFDQPYHAKSISEFWRRWHMTLSTWLRDYVFLPTAYAGARRLGDRAPLGVGGEYWSYFASIGITMTLAGAWHGLSVTFLVWGALMGAYMVISRATKKVRARCVRLVGLDRLPTLRNALRVTVTFSLVCLAWIVFRAESLRAAWYIWTHLLGGIGGYLTRAIAGGWLPGTGTGLVAPFLLGQPREEFAIAVGGIVVVEFVQWMQRRGSVRQALSRTPPLVRWAVYYGLVLAILVFGVFETKTFIYARF
jgi:D-alanyl-lipoteichoic acid acyltransferase DltB (MBOAT superfamily)